MGDALLAVSLRPVTRETYDRGVAEIRRIADRLGIPPEKVTSKIYEAEATKGAPFRGFATRLGARWIDAARAAAKIGSAGPEIEIDLSHLDTTIGDKPEKDRLTIDDIAARYVEPRPARYVITWAQNATPLDDDWFATLLVYCEETNAQLRVIKGRYKNPTSIWQDKDQEAEWWDPRIERFAVRGNERLCQDFTIDRTPIQPTAVRPLTGFEPRGSGAIFGSPKVQLTSLPGAVRGEPRILVTTGAVTIENYTDSKAGSKARAHHCLAAVVVEVEDDRVVGLRHLNYSRREGAMIDLDRRYSPEGVEPAPRPVALVMGDIHVAQRDDEILDASLYAPDSIAQTLRPEHIVYHDVLDFRARNHHHNADDRYLARDADVGEEIEEARAFLERTPDFAKAIVVASNHDQALDRWLRESDPRIDPRNAAIFHELRAAQIRDNFERSAFRLHCETRGTRARFLGIDEPFELCGVELGQHGHLGPNGTRGSLLAFAKLGRKMTIGHGHSAGIIDGARQVGLSGLLDQGYNHGPSNWSHCHDLVHPDGKRQLVFLWRRKGRVRWHG